MARYRLRFQLQEVDLPLGETLIGRSLDCQVTLEDPLVSRVHARVVVSEEDALVEDLGSRNGLRVNGAPLRGPTRIKDGDRIRIGTQDVVVTRIEPTEAARHSRATGVLRLCANCKLPYPRELVQCPNCEATEQEEEETLSGAFAAGASPSWSVQLLVEALERALSLGRIGDAERILQRTSAQLEEQLQGGQTVDSKQLAAVGMAALRVSLDRDDAAWARWVLRILRHQRVVPSVSMAEQLSAIAKASSVAIELGELLVALRTVDRPLTADETESLVLLEELRAAQESKDLGGTDRGRLGAGPAGVSH